MDFRIDEDKNKTDESLKLRGRMIFIKEIECLFYLATPM